MNGKAAGKISADHPLTDPDEDQLGYRDFARTLAHSVLRGSPAEGLVVGIYGEWGLGKTTLLNFIEHSVKRDPDAQDPIVVRFNPWWFSGRDDLLARFFLEFEAAVSGSLKPSVARLAKRLKPLARVVSKLPASALDGVQPGLGTVTHALGSFLGSAAVKPAIEIKRALTEEMAGEVLRILVIIDDIDRLLPDEMIDIFRLVRAVADFPNVTYLLAMDRAVVTRALVDRYGNFGERYLDKIVQVSFDLPVPKSHVLDKFFQSRLTPLLEGAPEELVDMRRWGVVYERGLRSFLKTPRDVVRFLNALSLTYPGLRDEVNPIDFIAVEALRVFKPILYRGIQEHADQFVGLGAAMRASEDGLRARLREFHEGWLPTEDRAAILAIVSDLFPVFARAFSNASGASFNESSWRLARRVCAEEYFDTYFHYALGESALPRLEVARVLALGEEQQLTEFERLARERTSSESNRFRQIFEGIMDRASAPNGPGVGDVRGLLRNCFKVGELVAEPGAEYLFSEGDDRVLAHAIEIILRTLPEPERSAAILEGLPSSGVTFGTRVVMELAVEHGRHGESAIEPERQIVTDLAMVERLEAVALAKIEAAVADGSLWSSKRLRQVLFAWAKLSSADRVKQAVATRISSDDALMAFLALVIPPPRKSREGRMTVSTLEELFDLESVAGRAEILAQGSGWTTVETDAARYVTTARAAKAAGRLGRFGEV